MVYDCMYTYIWKNMYIIGFTIFVKSQYKYVWKTSTRLNIVEFIYNL